MEVEDYIDYNGMYMENRYLILRRLREEDKNQFMDLVLDTSSIRKAYDDKSFFEFSWKNSLEDKDLNLSLFSKDSGVYMGNLMLKNFSADKQEIGIDIVKAYRRRGIGFAAIKLLLEHAKEVSGRNCFEARVYSDNLASRRLFEKLGAVEIGREETEIVSAVKGMMEMIGEEEREEIWGRCQELVEREEGRWVVVYEERV